MKFEKIYSRRKTRRSQETRLELTSVERDEGSRELQLGIRYHLYGKTRSSEHIDLDYSSVAEVYAVLGKWLVENHKEEDGVQCISSSETVH